MSVKPIVTLIKNNLWAVISGVLSLLWILTISYAESWGINGGKPRWMLRRRPPS